MKITDKISLLIIVLLLVLGTNAFIGISLSHKISKELEEVVKGDMALVSLISTLTENQLEKAILIEKMFRISEELGGKDLLAARRHHLTDHVQLIEEQFGEYSQQNAGNILTVQDLLRQGVKKSKSQKKTQHLRLAVSSLDRIEQASIYYDKLIDQIFQAIQTGSYQLDFDDLQNVQQGEHELTVQTKHLLAYVRNFAQAALSQAWQYQRKMKEHLQFSLLISIVFSSVIAYSIIRSISRPLKSLAAAAGQVGTGDFKVSLQTKARDEVGEVSRAFNTMTAQLEEFRAKLEEKNKMLADNLEITQEQKKELEAVNKELDRFVHTVSHDIGAPLRGITWYGTYLTKNYSSLFDKKGQECLDGVCRSAQRLTAMIEDLLALTRISRIKNPYEEVSLEEMIGSIRERLFLVIKQHDVDLSVPEGLPEIVCDRIKITEVIYNLVSNAIKFSSKENSGCPRVEVGYEDKGDVHQLSVKDNGIGIDPASHTEVFEVFARLHNYKEYEGTGTGLSIVKTVIEDHGGKVWIDSQVGQGATFYFTIPKGLLSRRAA